MIMKKLLITGILVIAFAFSGYSQSEKAKDKAKEKVEQLASWVEAGDPSAALSDTQKEQIFDLYAQMRKEINDLKDKYPHKGSDFESERKEINKKYNHKVNKEVLSREQRKAKRKGKKMSRN